MQKILILLNDPPYGTERTYNGLRLALELAKHDDVSLKIFMQSDAVVSAIKNQNTPEGYYNLGRMIKGLLNKGVLVSI